MIAPLLNSNDKGPTVTTLERKLAAELFRVQCKILDLGTTKKSADFIRKELMKLREEIILVRTS